MSLGPLGRLRLFGFVCPCHESDDEFVARVCVQNLKCVQVQWLRNLDMQDTNTPVVCVDASITVLDRPLGPTFQLICSDPKRGNVSDLPVYDPSSHFTERGNQLFVEVPLFQIDRVTLCNNGDNDRGEIIQLYAYDTEEETKKPRLLLQFRPTGGGGPLLLDTVEDLTGVLQWDRVRRADLEANAEHLEAMQRLRDERKRLLDAEREPTL